MKTSVLLKPTILALLLLPCAAYGYIGPGPGLSMIGSFYTLVAGIVIALFFVLLYPIRLLLKKRARKTPDTSAE